MAASDDGADFVLERVFEAPRELVFAAWTEPAHLAEWWGPFGYSTRATVDARAGGAYELVMRNAAGDEYPMRGVYREFVANERIVYTAELRGHPDAWYGAVDPTGAIARDAYDHVTTVTFESLAPRRTRVTIRTRFQSQAVRDALAKHGMRHGWGQSLDKLDAKIASDAPERELVQVREYEAPRERVWAAVTEPAELAKWWGPSGFTLTTIEHDLRPGGAWQYVMHGPDGASYPNKSIYTEVKKPERLAWKQAGGKEDGKGVHFVATLTLVERDGKTLLTLRQRFESPDDRAFVVTTHKAIEGGVQTFTRLQQHLARV